MPGKDYYSASLPTVPNQNLESFKTVLIRKVISREVECLELVYRAENT
jgi:hypothetical protein